ncbi:protein mesh [Patella vulgata]|uniref:protein mesh n=1 Tax=Patella vulgata TaxID=6465 RepID=UPI00217F7E3E|nr:protein mesh [Patella vulgata]
MSPNAWYTGKRRVHSRWLRIFCVLSVLIAVFPLNTKAVRLQDLYKFNTTNGDKLTDSTDDGGSGPINITVSFPFFTKKHDKLYVNNNGVISFLKELKDYKPSDFPLKDETPIIAPFWADVDVTKGGRVWYREDTHPHSLHRATSEVNKFFPNERNFQATWIFIATWDHVCFYGAAGDGENKKNTFQAVLITNGKISFVIFNYEKIEWTTGSNSGGDTTTGLGGNPAQAGFNAGDQKTFYEIQGARNEAVINLTLTSNVGIPGKWFFKVDSAQTQERCSNSGSGPVNLWPQPGNMLGGYFVNITSPCFSIGDKLTGRIDDTNQTFPCEVLDESKARCVFPTIFRTGRLNFSLKINESGWNYTGLYTVVNLAHTHGQVTRVDPTKWIAKQNGITNVRVEWDKTVWEGSGIPSSNVHIQLLTYKETKTGPEFIEVKTNGEVFTNSGKSNLKLPKMEPDEVLAVIKISCASFNKTDSWLPAIWSDVFFVRWEGTSQSEELCNGWLGMESQTSNVTLSEPCPCTLGQAVGDTGRYQPYPLCDSTSTAVYNCLYKPGAATCLIPNYIGSRANSEVCCYDKDGELLDARESEGGGTLTRYHYRSQGDQGDNIVPFFTYLKSDILPSLHCCQYSTNQTLCKEFLHYRLPATCQGYEPPAAAQAAGDPHLVTLDGKSFTFNAVGEFILVEDKNKSVIVQVRADQARDINDTLQKATIFSAIAMQVMNTSDRLEILRDEEKLVKVLVNGEEIEQTDLDSTSQLNGLTVYKNNTGNATSQLTVVMDSVGMSVLVEATQDLLNIMIMVGSPTLKGQLEGLLGNYNGDPKDDFLSRNGTSISSESTMKDIHYGFGMSWAVPEKDSLFTRDVGLSSVAANSSFVPDFIDSINLTVSNETNKICGENKQCRYDLDITKKESIAQATKKFATLFEERKKGTQPVVRCPFVDEITNGNRTVSGYKPGSNVTFVCHEGFQFIPPVTSVVLKCQADGTWSGVFPRCVQEKKAPSSLTPKQAELIGMVLGGFILVLVIIIGIVLVSRVCKKRCGAPKKRYTSGEYESVEIPELFTPSSSDIPSPVFENPSFLESLQKLSSDAGRFKIPRPDYVDPNIYSEYF